MTNRVEPTAALPPVPLSSKRRWAITIGVLIGMFMAALEATVVSTAMPTIIGKFGALDRYSWPTSAYLITSTVTVPVWGKLSDIYGRRLLYQIGIAIFLIGSILCGMSASMDQLIIFRLIQGFGAGALVPLTMTIIGDIYTLTERARMQAVFSAVWGIASIIGPLVGGLLTENLSWRYVFYINIPVGIVAAIILEVALREPPRSARPKIDYAGAIMLMVAITLLMTALQGNGGLASLVAPRNLALFVGALVSLALFAAIEMKAGDPIIPFNLFRNRMVTIANLIAFLGGVSMFAVIVFVPLFAQGVKGAKATEAGSLLTPFMLSWVILSIIGGRLLLRFGYRPTVLAGLIILTAGFAGFSTFGPATSRTLLYIDLIVIGSGMGLIMLTLLLAVQHAVERSQLGIATSLNQFARSIGGAFGVAVMGAVLSVGMQSKVVDPSSLISPLRRAQLPPAVLQSLQGDLSSSLHAVFWLATGLAVLGIVLSFWLPTPHRQDPEPPKTVADAETGERLVMAEMTTIDAPHEPIIG